MTPWSYDTDEMGVNEWAEVTQSLIRLAKRDHDAGTPAKRSGKELCEMFFSGWRNGHAKMMTGLYNKMRWSFEIAEKANKETPYA